MLKIGYDVGCGGGDGTAATRQEQNPTDREITFNASVLGKQYGSSPFGGNSKDAFLELSKLTSCNKLFFFITHLLSRLFGIMAEKFCFNFCRITQPLISDSKQTGYQEKMMRSVLYTGTVLLPKKKRERR